MWNPFKKSQTQSTSEQLDVDALINQRITSMVEACFEYVKWNKEDVTDIFIFCSAEAGLFLTWFYRIGGKIVKKHMINSSTS